MRRDLVRTLLTRRVLETATSLGMVLNNEPCAPILGMRNLQLNKFCKTEH